MRRLLPHPILSTLLLALWLLAFNSVAAGTVLSGLLVALLLPLAARPFWPEAPTSVRLGPVPRLLAVVLWDILVANLRVARLVLGPPDRLHPRFLLVPLQVESPAAITLLASIITLTPGTVSSNVSGDRRTLLVHALSEPDPEAAVAQIKARYERPILEIFGC